MLQEGKATTLGVRRKKAWDKPEQKKYIRRGKQRRFRRKEKTQKRNESKSGQESRDKRRAREENQTGH